MTRSERTRGSSSTISASPGVACMRQSGSCGRGSDSRHVMRGLLAALAAWLTMSTAGLAQEKPAAAAVVSIVNWSDYIDPGVLDDFTSETGIKIVYDTYDSNDTLQARLLAGKRGYDVVDYSAGLLQRDTKAGFY